MKLKELLNKAEEIKTFEDAWDVMTLIHDHRSHDFELIRKENGWVCKVNKITKKIEGKDITYKYTFVWKESGKNMTDAAKNAILAFLQKELNKSKK